jgi:capsular exopolysaccharide synthesis family protein
MTINEFLHTIWRRKFLVLVIALIHVGLTYGALRSVTPLYESSSTLQVAPKDVDSSALLLFGTLDEIVPIYSEAATSRQTHRLAERRTDLDLPKISVETFEGAPLIDVKARDADPDVARIAVQTVVQILIEQARAGTIGVRSLRLDQLDAPIRADEPVYPRKALTLGITALFGVALGIAVAFLRERLVTRVETAEILSRLASAPCYAEVPRDAAVGRLKNIAELETKPRLRPVAESFRDFRTNLLFSEPDFQSLVVTSPEGSHGKTTISLGLAMTLANAGTRTVVVDGDLRKGRVSELLRLRRRPGLADAMGGTALEDAIQRTSVENLDAVTAGVVLGEPGELLLSEFADVLAQLETRYEAVVIDAPPVGPVNDPRIIARFAKHTVIVAAADAATRRNVRATVEQLSLIGVEPTAVVLNRAKRPAGRYYDGYLVPEAPRAERQKTRAGSRWRLSRTG